MNHEFVREYVVLDILVDGAEDQVVLKSLPLFHNFLPSLGCLIKMIILFTKLEVFVIQIIGAIDEVFAILLEIIHQSLPFSRLGRILLVHLVSAPYIVSRFAISK